MHKSSMELMTAFSQKYVKPGSRVLDVGSMNKNGCYRDLFTECEYHGLDMEKGNNVHIVSVDPYIWPINNEVYDVVISGQCMEHVPQPWVWIKEIARVVRKDGLVIIIAPWQWKPHYYPLDCWRVLPDGMKGLFKYAGIDIIETDMKDNDCYAVGRKI